MDTDPEKIIEDKNQILKPAAKPRGYLGSLTAHQKVTLLVALASTGFLIVAIAVLAIVITGLPDTGGGVCKNISESLRTGVSLNVAPDPIYYNLCGLANCTFNIGTCTEVCVFGYASDTKGCPASCECSNEGLFEGDIQFSNDEASMLRTKLTPVSSGEKIDIFKLEDSSYLKLFQVPTWGHGSDSVVPILLDPSFSDATKSSIRSYLNEVASKTCVRVKDREYERHFLYIYSGDQCSAEYGRKIGQTNMMLNEKYCIYKATVQHLFMHILGFYHESSRSDRDDHIDVIWDNVAQDQTRNLNKFDPFYWIDLGIPYDTLSIIHYPSEAFSVGDGKKTVVGKSDKPVRGDKVETLYQGIRESDVLKIKTLYQCLGAEEYFNAAQWGDWTSWVESKKRSGYCIRMRTCKLKSKDKIGVCLDQNTVSTKYEIAEKTRPCSAPGVVEARVDLSENEDYDLPLRRQPRVAEINFGEPVKLSRRICPNGRLLAGTFDSDIYSDLLCLYGDGYIRIYLGSLKGMYDQLNWEGATPFCRYDKTSKVYSADLNRDGLTDLVCHRTSGIIETIILKNGFFEPFVDWSGTLVGCEGQGKRIYTADVNGDGQADILCGEDDDFHVSHIFLNQYTGSG